MQLLNTENIGWMSGIVLGTQMALHKCQSLFLSSAHPFIQLTFLDQHNPGSLPHHFQGIFEVKAIFIIIIIPKRGRQNNGSPKTSTYNPLNLWYVTFRGKGGWGRTKVADGITAATQLSLESSLHYPDGFNVVTRVLMLEKDGTGFSVRVMRCQKDQLAIAGFENGRGHKAKNAESL